MKLNIVLILGILHIGFGFATASQPTQAVQQQMPQQAKQQAPTPPKPLPPMVQDVRASTQGNTIRIVMDITKMQEMTVSILTLPARVVIDINNPYAWGIPDNIKKEYPSIIQGVRHGKFNDKIFRVVFDMSVPITLEKAYILPPNQGIPVARLVIEGKYAERSGIVGANNKIIVLPPTAIPSIEIPASRSPQQIVPAPANQSKNEEVDEVAMLNKHKNPDNGNKENGIQKVAFNQEKDNKGNRIKKGNGKNGRIVVVLDPGHGGKDPGATAQEIIEKEITLKIALRLKEELDKNAEIETHLTRTGDYYISLVERTRIAKEKKANIFISIHADKTSNPKARGLSVYTLSDVASDKEAEALAAKENRAELLLSPYVSKEDFDVSSILISLMQRETMNESTKLAKNVLAEARNITEILENPHRKAGFMVLKAPDIPSVLIEMGFLSNEKDILKFQDEKHIEKLAESVSNSVERYLWANQSLSVKPMAVKRAESKKRYAFVE